MKKLSVTIGIPAYNEGANIKNLLLSLLNQKNPNYILKKIIVISDNSSDNTVAEVKSVNNKKIKLIENDERKGQAVGQNKIIENFDSDILVLLNADILPKGKLFISRLIIPILKNPKVGIVCPKMIPVKEQNFFGGIINYSVNFKDYIFENWRNGGNIQMCKGAARAFSKEFAKKISWPESLSEDAFSYLYAVTSGYKFVLNRYSKAYFKSPDNFMDHIRQSARFMEGPKIMSRYFDKDVVASEYALPKTISFSAAVRFFLLNPVLFSSYVLTFLVIKINPNKGGFAKSKWQISKSSKMLNI